MRTDNIKKYVLPNIPYLFVLWACLKLGTAYRLAAGADFAHKLMGLGQTIGPAFADFAPGLAPFDWLIGIMGAVGFRLLIYFKSKNAKKYRRDEEYGSARWGTEKDIKPFIDPKFENNIILTGTEFARPARAKPASGSLRRFCRPARIKTADAAMCASIRKAGCSPRWALSYSDAGIGSRCSIPLIFQNPCTTIHWPISRMRPTSLNLWMR